MTTMTIRCDDTRQALTSMIAHADVMTQRSIRQSIRDDDIDRRIAAGIALQRLQRTWGTLLAEIERGT